MTPLGIKPATFRFAARCLSFVMCVRLSVRVSVRMNQRGPDWTGFDKL
jgi:hypothetical protein